MVSLTDLRSGCGHSSFLSHALLPLQPHHLSEPDAAPTAATAFPEEVCRRWSALLVHALAAAPAAFRARRCSRCSHSAPREDVQEMVSFTGPRSANQST